jgi:acetolactate decarboxylase
MKSGISRGAVLLLAALCACSGTGRPSPAHQASGTVWQLSPFALLQQGAYDGLMPVGAVRRHGDFGLGAADRLDGEMIVVDGRFYRFAEDGVVQRVPDLMMMPFAEVTFWRGGTDVVVPGGVGYDTLKSAVDSELPTLDAFYAVRIEGTWDSVAARTYKLQTRRPSGTYPPLDSAAADTFTIRNAQGVMVGFRQPPFAGALAVPSYHLHFINADSTLGGHVIDFKTAGEVRVQVSDRPDYTLRMPPPPASP